MFSGYDRFDPVSYGPFLRPLCREMSRKPRNLNCLPIADTYRILCMALSPEVRAAFRAIRDFDASLWVQEIFLFFIARLATPVHNEWMNLPRRVRTQALACEGG
jgi:hypothetical protein